MANLPATVKTMVILLLLILSSHQVSQACPAEGERLMFYSFFGIQRKAEFEPEIKASGRTVNYLSSPVNPDVGESTAPLNLLSGSSENLLSGSSDNTDMLTLQERLFFDGLGIPYVDYGYIDGVYIGIQRNQVTVAQKSWTWLNRFKETGDTYSYNYFFNCSQWLIENSKPFSGGLILPYRFEYPPYGLKPEWYSAMAQGQAVQTMVYAYRLSQNTAYLNFAKKMLKPLWVEIKHGGVAVKLSENAYWYEEYASKSIEPPMTLNGMIFCLLGIYEYYLQTGDEEAKKLFDNGINAVLLLVDRFDCNGWSYYDLRKKKATYHYHSIHVNQMLELYKITGEEKFLYYHKRWSESLKNL